MHAADTMELAPSLPRCYTGGHDEPTPIVDAPSTPPHRFRGTRIAVSVFFGLLTVVWSVLWAASYLGHASFMGRLPNGSFSTQSYLGSAVLYIGPSLLPWRFGYYHPEETPEIHTKYHTGAHFVFQLDMTSEVRRVRIPHWFAVIVCGILTVIPWLPSSSRFSLRSLLIATTLVAVVLGFIVYVLR